MKTKLSKRILSMLLAALMVITSIPLVAVTAYAEESPTKPLTDAMSSFNSRLQETDENGNPVLLTNVAPAYAAYVACQEAIDAYLYGGETGALTGKAKALEDAVGEIETFEGYQGTKVPTFTDSTESEMQQADDKAFWNNILWTEKCTSAVAGSFGTSQVTSYVYYSANTVMLYDGKNPTMMPVMASAKRTDKNDRYVYGVYPCGSNDDNASGMALKGEWKFSSTTGTLDFDYAVYTADGNPGWGSESTQYGKNGVQSTSYRSQLLTRTRPNGWSAWTYVVQHGANGLSFSKPAYTTVGSETLPYAKYTPSWYFGTGNGANSGTNDNKTKTTTAPIYVIDYSYLMDGLKEAGGRMKTISPLNYSEGGLTNYINAMEAVTAFNPNSSFTSSTNLETTVQNCARNMITLTDTAQNTPVTANNPDYQILRNAMTEKIKETYAAGNGTGFYTTESWNAFTAAYDAIKNIMADCNDHGYGHDFSQKSAQSLADDLRLAAAPYNEETGKGLKSNVHKVDTTELVAAIESFELLITENPGIFTDASIASVQSVINTAKSVVWQGGTMIDANAKDYSEANQAEVATHTANINNALANLRISPEAPTVLDNGQFSSLNYVLTLRNNIDDPNNYNHWNPYADAHSAAQTYVTTLANTPFTDLETQLAAYNQVVQNVQTTYDALTRAFTLIEDGTIAYTGDQSAITTLEKHENSDKYNWWIDFDYPSSAVILKTNHNPLTVKYGKANLTYKINIDNNINMPNNAIDSITINGTADANNEITSKEHNLTSGNKNRPAAIEDATLRNVTYAGCLAVDAFSLSNFRVGHATNDEYTYYGRLSDGTYISEKYPANDAFATILGTTDGLGSDAPTPGCINLKPGAKGNSEISLAADMNVYISSADTDPLTRETIPSVRTIEFKNHYFGATIIWNTQPVNNFAGYAYLTSKSNNQTMYSKVEVVDLTNLFRLIDECNRLQGQGYKYDTDLWNTFDGALTAAKEDLEYAQLGAQQDGAEAIRQACENRYTALWDAYKALEFKTLEINFNYKTATGEDTTQTFTVKYGDTLNQHKTAIENISKPSYDTNDGATTWTFSKWTPSISYTTPIEANVEYNAEYTSVNNLAIWDGYNEARGLLLGALENKDYTYYSGALRQVNEAIKGFAYFEYTDAQKAATRNTAQDAIDAEEAVMRNLIKNVLKEVTIDTSAAAAYAEKGKAAVIDIDRYDTERLEQYKVDSFYYETVNVYGTDIIGIKYESQEAIEAEITTVANALNSEENMKSYQIYVDGNPVGDPVLYGTPVIVDADNTVHTDVEDTNAPTYTGDAVAWRYSYAAPSNEYTQTSPKYMLTAPCFGFILKGDTYLTTSKAKEAGNSYTVTILSSANGKVIDKVTTAGKYTMPIAPNYTGYAFAGYSNGAIAGQEITVSADTTITASYSPRAVTTYQIDYYAVEAGFSQTETPVPTQALNVTYNQLVSLTADNAYCWAKAYFDLDSEMITYTIIHYGSMYNFYACESIADRESQTEGIVALTKGDLIKAVTDTNYYNVVDTDGTAIEYSIDTRTDEVIIKENITVDSLEDLVNVYNSEGNIAKYSMVGHYILPEGYSMVECGFIYAADVNATDLTVDKVDNYRLYRFKSSRYTCGNQFVINLVNDGVHATFNYAPYAIVRNDKTNELVTVYGTTHLDVTIN